MRIVATSDTHGATPNLPAGDLLIHAGDWSGRGDYKDTIAFVKWMEKVAPKYKHGAVVVPGNHDRWIENSPSAAVAALKDVGVRMLLNESILVGGLGIYGTPYSLPFCNWAFPADEYKCAQAFNRIPPDTQIIISHGPPKGHFRLDWGRICRQPSSV